jgi:hypothetical protein
VHSAHMFIMPIDVQAGFELMAVSADINGANFSHCSMVWGHFPQARGSRCHRV